MTNLFVLLHANPPLEDQPPNLRKITLVQLIPEAHLSLNTSELPRCACAASPKGRAQAVVRPHSRDVVKGCGPGMWRAGLSTARAPNWLVMRELLSMGVEIARNQGGKSASSRSSLHRIWVRMRHFSAQLEAFRGSRDRWHIVLSDSCKRRQLSTAENLIVGGHSAFHGALRVLVTGSMHPLDLDLIPSFHPSLCAQKYAQNQLQRPCQQWINDQ